MRISDWSSDVCSSDLPGRRDAANFHVADPSGFLMGFVDDQPVACISVVRYGDGYGFLGFYIVARELRGRGHGMAVWQAGLQHLGSRTIGLDGVVAQQDNRSEEHTSELQSLMRISYAVFCLKKKQRQLSTT